MSENVQAAEVSGVAFKTSVEYTDNILAISALVMAPYILALSIGDIVVTPFE